MKRRKKQGNNQQSRKWNSFLNKEDLCNKLPQTYLHFVGQKSSWAQLGSLLSVSQGQNPGVHQAGHLSERSGKGSTFLLIWVVGRIQFPAAVELRSRFLAGCLLQVALNYQRLLSSSCMYFPLASSQQQCNGSFSHLDSGFLFYYQLEKTGFTGLM